MNFIVFSLNFWMLEIIWVDVKSHSKIITVISNGVYVCEGHNLLIYLWLFCSIDVKAYVTGHGSTDWKKTHEAAGTTAIVVTTMLRYGATCVGKTVMDELGFGYSFFT